ncbi:MAG: alkaline phosphatase [Clostridia bacterium]|nr:alkaline phosphatase [Clostridia bacterium]
MSKRLIALLLSIIMILMVFVGCNDTTTNDPTDTNATENNQTDAPAQSKVPDGYVSLAENGVANYRVVFDDALPVKTYDSFGKYILRVKSKTGADLDISNDAATPYTDGAKEILIGNTDRPVSAKYASQVRVGESLVCYDAETQAIVIVAGSDEALVNAVAKFFEDYANAKDRYFAVPTTLKDEVKKNFPIGDVTFGSVNLAEFGVVYPEGADLLTEYAALNLVDYIEINMGITLDIYDDSEDAREHEFLVGETNRPESDIAVYFDDGEYLLMQNEGKIVMQGEGLYIGAAVGAFISFYLESDEDEVSLDAIPTDVVTEYYVPAAYCSNVILMIGDGMGFNHIDMALANGLDTFYARLLDVQGSAITRSQSVLNGDANYTDSAASATALACAYKTINGYLGMDSNKNSVQNVRELAYEAGAQTAVVTTDTITGATPAGFLCHHDDRNDSSILQSQITNLKNEGKVDYLAGSVGDNLPKETRTALKTIADSEDPFFIMVEGAYIDKVSHSNDYAAAIKNVIRFNDAIAYSLMFAMCHPGTAVIVTADHECGGLNEDTSSKYGYKYTSSNHTNRDVPVYAFGPEVEIFDDVATENIDIARFIAMVFGDNSFGQSTPVPPRN